MTATKEREVSLRFLATFYRRQTETNDHGPDYDTWEPEFTEWVGVEPGASRLRITETTVNAQQAIERGTDKITMRYRSDVSEDMRVEVEGHKYGIVRIIDVDLRHRWIVIDAIIADRTKFDPS